MEGLEREMQYKPPPDEGVLRAGIKKTGLAYVKPLQIR